MTTNTPGDIHLNENRQTPPAPTGVSGETNPMNQINYTTINIQIASEPKTNARKARCKHCMKLLQPGEGVGYTSEFGYGGSRYYLCQTDAAVHDRIEATLTETASFLESIAVSLARLLDSKGGVDTDLYLGYISLRNGASLAYGRIRLTVEASGMYRLEVARAIDLALVEEAPATVDDVTALAERVAVEVLFQVFVQTNELLWVDSRLCKAVMETRIPS